MKITVAIIPWNETATECLLGKRADNGRWALLGGHMEEGETSEQTIRREIMEEIGVSADRLEHVGFFDGTLAHGARALVLVYTTVIHPGAVRNMEPEKNTDLQWWSMWNINKADPWCGLGIIHRAQEIVLNGR
jgi:8-oxo-dGTP pyrophosphatase MutT (NUDIX family)